MSVIESKPLTPVDLLLLPNAKDFELVGGELVERHVSVLSSYVEARLVRRLDAHCEDGDLGPVFTATNGIQCFPDEPNKVRKPDVSFVKKARFAPQHLYEGYLTIAPDLAVEVVSPNDLGEELEQKIEDYLAAGIPLVWVVYPEVRTVSIHRGDGSVTKLRRHDELTGEDIIPGFRCKVAELFPTA